MIQVLLEPPEELCRPFEILRMRENPNATAKLIPRETMFVGIGSL
jgi:hypothetical protein